jgi:hypothetical protein
MPKNPNIHIDSAPMNTLWFQSVPIYFTGYGEVYRWDENEGKMFSAQYSETGDEIDHLTWAPVDWNDMLDFGDGELTSKALREMADLIDETLKNATDGFHTNED